MFPTSTDPYPVNRWDDFSNGTADHVWSSKVLDFLCNPKEMVLKQSTLVVMSPQTKTILDRLERQDVKKAKDKKLLDDNGGQLEVLSPQSESAFDNNHVTERARSRSVLVPHTLNQQPFESSSTPKHTFKSPKNHRLKAEVRLIPRHENAIRKCKLNVLRIRHEMIWLINCLY
ncbi:kinesin-like protein Klp8 [Puccinia graminis f. sp. tritici]|uniref:Kinesin-like protein Klp8 n=1 Tax=Puccinia graminis f. sp. tritici TaxID=56615 RepID=A0A5B0Q155_PUCGR|nr:kinesin-like protein Klp8 [Puccinia graminis f. sp. tritici]